MPGPAHVTILARNYLPRALMLADSLAEHGAEEPLVIFLTDATPETDLPALPNVRWMTPADIALPWKTVLTLAMSYDLVEFATAVKPLVLKALLSDHEYAIYLDPDTYVTSPMQELVPALDAGAGIALTPHYLEPTPAANRFTEGHLLHVGVFNLGFCAVARKALPFLDWWWSHLRDECLHGPLDGLFVDQKWVDVGAVLFDATTLRHYGYNVGATNLHERPITADDDGLLIASSGDRLRLFHFHAFDPHSPELYGRASTNEHSVGPGSPALEQLSGRYAKGLLEKIELVGPPPAYGYGADCSGRKISRRMRHAYRVAAAEDPALPSPFVAAEADAYERWRRGARGLATKLMLSDLAKGARCAIPEEYDSVKKRFPGATRALRSRYVENSGMWG